MDAMLLMCAAALVLAAEQGFVTPEGTMPAVSEDADGNLLVTAGDQSVTVMADDAAELATELGDMAGGEADEASAEAPADATAEAPAE